jgi:hypothetical protein
MAGDSGRAGATSAGAPATGSTRHAWWRGRSCGSAQPRHGNRHGQRLRVPNGDPSFGSNFVQCARARGIRAREMAGALENYRGEAGAKPAIGHGQTLADSGCGHSAVFWVAGEDKIASCRGRRSAFTIRSERSVSCVQARCCREDRKRPRCVGRDVHFGAERELQRAGHGHQSTGSDRRCFRYSCKWRLERHDCDRRNVDRWSVADRRAERYRDGRCEHGWKLFGGGGTSRLARRHVGGFGRNAGRLGRRLRGHCRKFGWQWRVRRRVGQSR